MDIHIKGSSTSENYQTNIETRGLNLIVDEPLDKGGQDKGMTPMELIGAALASCTIITLQMYFNHKEWTYTTIHAEVDYNPTTFIFSRKIIVNANLDEKQISRIDRIANACPVHKMLEKGHTIETIIEVV